MSVITGRTLVFSITGNDELAGRLAQELAAPQGRLTMRQFPDGETYVRAETPCEGLNVVLAANLFHPNPSMLPLMFVARALRDAGARRVILVTPYLPYMRQDARFQLGEVVTSRIFAQFLSSIVDGLVTIDPHLHRIHSLDEIYSIPSRAEQAAPAVAAWIRDRVLNPVIVGPDGESEQWVSRVATMSDAPYLVLSKQRRGDRSVDIEVPSLGPWRDHTPVLLDDIISTGRTMIETLRHLLDAGYVAPVCIAVHAVFAGDAFEQLEAAGAAQIVTCNTVPHESNQIDLTPMLIRGIRGLTNSRRSQALSLGEES